MVIIILGLMVLLAALFPFGGPIVMNLLGGMYGPTFGRGSPAIYHLVMLLANNLPAALVAIGFVRFSGLSTRLPPAVPGKVQILIGLVLTVLFLVPRLLASMIEGGGAAMAVGMFAPYFLIPAKILIVIGVTRVLLAAGPPGSYPKAAKHPSFG